jgi:hypothetical protein
MNENEKRKKMGWIFFFRLLFLSVLAMTVDNYQIIWWCKRENKLRDDDDENAFDLIQLQQQGFDCRENNNGDLAKIPLSQIHGSAELSEGSTSK